MAQADVAAAGDLALDAVRGLEALDHRPAIVKAAGQGHVFQTQPRRAVAEGALAEIEATVQEGRVQCSRQGGAAVHLARQRLGAAEEQVPDRLYLSLDGDLARHVAGADDRQA
ncbi:hypothetical protein D3C77_398830 [compost metagenome]